MGQTAIRFQLEIRDKLAAKNLLADHLNRLENGETGNLLSDCFPDETLYVVTDRFPWYANIVDCIGTKTFPKGLSRA